jgi:hypothetical protein
MTVNFEVILKQRFSTFVTAGVTVDEDSGVDFRPKVISKIHPNT